MLLYFFAATQTNESEFIFVKSDRTPASLKAVDKGTFITKVGYLDGSGTFICEKTIVRKLFRDPNSPPPKVPVQEVDRRPMKVIEYNYINIPKYVGESVYEYRSGKLVPGYLTKDYRFEEEPTEETIDFKNYKYSKDAWRIYNLPGKFMSREQFFKAVMRMK